MTAARYIYDVGTKGNCLFGHNAEGREVGFLMVGMCNIPFGAQVDIERDENGFTKSVVLVKTGENIFNRAKYEEETAKFVTARKAYLRGDADRTIAEAEARKHRGKNE